MADERADALFEKLRPMIWSPNQMESARGIIRADVAALEQQVAELRADAERYRWLRNWIPASTVQHFSKIKGHAPEESESQKVDVAIDAARSR